jgi:hypothetical protein
MQSLITQKACVPRVPCVPCVPTYLKAFKFGAYEAGTQKSNSWNTLSMGRKRCSRLISANRQSLSLLADGTQALPGATTRVFPVACMGRGANDEQ